MRSLLSAASLNSAESRLAGFSVVAVFEALALVSIWELTRLALKTRRWFDIACATSWKCAQSCTPRRGGNWRNPRVPDAHIRRLRRDQHDDRAHATGLLTTSMLFALPILAAPSLLTGLAINDRLAQGAILAAVTGGFLFAGGATLLFSDRIITGIGTALDWLTRRIHLKPNGKKPMAPRLLESRDFVRDALTDSWRLAVGVHLHPALIVFAFVVASTLAMIPLTPSHRVHLATRQENTGEWISGTFMSSTTPRHATRRNLGAYFRARAQPRTRCRRASLTRSDDRRRVGSIDAEVSVMAESVYKVIELVGTSSESWEKAAAAAVEKASASLRDLRIATVAELDLQLEDGVVKAYRARVKVSFKYED